MAALLEAAENVLTLIMLTWTIWRASTNASKWRMGFNSAFKGLIEQNGQPLSVRVGVYILARAL